MARYKFGEKTAEYYAKTGKDIPVWQTQKYEEAKRKATEILDSGKYGLSEGDFWILMNATKNGKMAYNGLIISHNGCLKINDSLSDRFRPSCVTLDKSGYAGSLVYTYCNDEQGLYEVGEVSAGNCKNEYPYAMAYKRLFDRVVLKLSKLAYAGIYSDSESDEFTQKLEASAKLEANDQGTQKPEKQICIHCKKEIPAETAEASRIKYGKVFCPDCQKAADEYIAQNGGWTIETNGNQG